MHLIYVGKPLLECFDESELLMKQTLVDKYFPVAADAKENI